jgi:hypothetical protein
LEKGVGIISTANLVTRYINRKMVAQYVQIVIKMRELQLKLGNLKRIKIVEAAMKGTRRIRRKRAPNVIRTKRVNP